MLKKLQVFALCLLALFNVAMAQNETTGKVVDEATKAPLAGATIKEIGTNSSTSTDDNGNFSIKLKNPKAFLLISYTGYGNKQIRADVLSKNNTITLNQDKENLEGVVVTALGIKKEKKSLGFSVSSVNSKDIDQNPQVDLGRALSGKAPGLNILGTSGLSGSGTNINIRGVASITQGSQPLFIVDGVPFDGGTNTATSGGGASGNSNFTYGNNNTSRFFDLDPNNIQSVEVLKSLAATTLYGELGANGVILITTKTGAHNNPRKKSEITVSYTYNVNEVANLPVYNNEWGGGFDLSVGLAFYSNWGGRFTNPPSLVNHPYNTAALAAAFPQFQGKQYELKFYDGVKGFFRKGGSQTTSINLSGGTKDATYTANYSYLDEDGFIVGNGTLRHNFGFGGSAKLSNRFSFNGTVNFVKSRVKSPPTSTSFGSGATNSSVFGDVLYTPTGVDLVGLPWENPITKGSIYYRPANDIQNPWWTVYNAFTENQTDRVYGNAAIKLDATKWLNISYRIGFDNYNENTLYAQNKGGIDGNPLGYYRTLSRENQIWDHTLFAQFKKDWEDGIGVTADLGYNLRQTSYFQQGQYSVEQLVYGLLDHTNFVTHSNESEDGSDLDHKFNAVSLGYFGTATVNYKDFIYVSAGGRYSTTSRLETKNSSIFYPNASVSFILTEAVEALQNLKGLNYLKFRFGYGTSAKFPDYEYVTRNALNIQTRTFVTRTGTVINTNAPSTFLANSNLKPELQSDIEFGIDGRFWDNRINVELSLYNKKSTDQILRQSLDPSTGFTSTLINAGNLDNKGIEVAFGINLVRTKDWNWKLDFLYSLNQSEVSNLPKDIPRLNFAGYTSLGNFAINGKPLGIILGNKVQRFNDPNNPNNPSNGKRIISTTGDFLYDQSDIQEIGDPNPLYRLTGISTLSWKGISFRMQWDYVQGGDIYSATSINLLARGVTADTRFDRFAPVILPGVNVNGNVNNIQISATQAYFNNGVGDPGENAVFDATTIRLREASLSYNFPSKLLSKSPFGNASITFSGSNLWYFAPNFPKYVNFDPETSGLGVSNGRGLEFFTGPSSRRYGVSLRLTF